METNLHFMRCGEEAAEHDAVGLLEPTQRKLKITHGPRRSVVAHRTHRIVSQTAHAAAAANGCGRRGYLQKTIKKHYSSAHYNKQPKT